MAILCETAVIITFWLVLPQFLSAAPEIIRTSSEFCPGFVRISSESHPNGVLTSSEFYPNLRHNFIRISDNILQLEDGHKEAVLSAHFAACDWMRELVNAFVQESDNDTKAKVISSTYANPGLRFAPDWSVLLRFFYVWLFVRWSFGGGMLVFSIS